MTFSPRPPLTAEPFAALTANARLELAPERTEQVAAMVDLANGLMDSLDRIPLGELPPASAFDARWE
ncbi:hypothetical protein [Mobilicoccus caccae]|uniref:DUF4089 domain-containing protein n=1 Tax=Mobilicoccus caccae TaxID=1859295 RepID=A0ABQ6IV67_9MICO|nr:hypothetical protein [Mobilicoccus caccae]GMA40604.1 hypothetical protein GCM10025883_26490 [Mobilicoccus caccae]